MVIIAAAHADYPAGHHRQVDAAICGTRDLQRSRERLVTAREEERRRLRRDLHDGLGPTLASLTLKLDAARNQLKQNPNETDSLLVELKSQTQSAIEDIAAWSTTCARLR